MAKLTMGSSQSDAVQIVGGDERETPASPAMCRNLVC